MKTRIFTLIMSLFVTMMAFAYDFIYEGLPYEIYDEARNEVCVTSQKSKLYGDIVVPEVVKFNGKRYTVMGIDNGTFDGEAITSITLPNSIRIIGQDAFGDISLIYLKMPNNSELKIKGPLGDIENLYLPDVATWYKVHLEWDILENVQNVYFDNEKITDLVIPNGVDTIGDYTFAHPCFSSVVIPNSVKLIGESAFRRSSLTSITLPKSIKKIGNSAFRGCASLTSVDIPGSVELGSWAFDSCTSLSHISISGGSIGFEAFYGCKSLSSVELGSGVTTIGSDVFELCSALKSITLPNSIKTIGEDAFFKSGLNKIILPNGLKKLGKRVFAECKYLNSVTISESITEIAADAFYDCRSLKTLIVKAQTPPNLLGDILSSSHSTNNITPRIPCGTIEVYRAASYWSYFDDFIEDILFDISITTQDRTLGMTSISKDCESKSICITAVPVKPNYHFVKWSDGNTENPRVIVVTKDINLTAEFAINQYQANVELVGNGVVTGTGLYNHGSEVTLTATANEHHHFVKWSDGSVENPRVFTVTSDVNLSAEFAINQYQATITSEGNGTVTGSNKYDYGSKATLSATPNEGYHFVEWSDGNTDNPRTITITDNISLSAKFAINTYTVNVSAGNNGSVTNYNGVYNYGTEINVKATANEHYHFVKWSDGSAENPRKIVVKDNVNIKAEFSIDMFNLNVIVENGSIAGCGSYEYGAIATITATANEGYRFVKWSDGNIANPRTIKMTQDIVLTAEFELKKYDVIAIGSTNGSVSGSGEYEHGKTAILNAIANNGYHFVKWSDGNTENPRTITVTSEVNLIAEFAANIYDVMVMAGENGSVSGGGNFEYGKKVILKATAKEHYHFVKWSDGNTENPRSLTVSEDVVLIAEFAINSYDVNLNVSGSGSVTGGGTYNYGKTAILLATPSENYHFVKWSDGNIDNPRMLAVTEDINLIAEFAIDVYTVTLNVENGTVTGAGEYNHGTEVTLTATPTEGYHFVRWSDGETNATRIITITSDVTLTAEFAINVYMVTLNAENGTVTGAGEYNHGTEVILTATPTEGYHFVRWSDGETNATRTITVTSDVTLTAEFAINQYQVTLESDGNGIVTGSGVYDYGIEVTIEAIANEGYHFVKWSDGNTENPRTIVVTEDVELKAEFAINQYEVNVTADENAMVTGSGTYDYGTEVMIEAIANEGYHFVQWSDGNTENPRTIVVTEDVELKAEFALNQYEVNVTADENGMVTGSGTYDYGTEVMIEAIANEGYRFVQWSDGNTENPRTIVLTEDVELRAEFEEDGKTLVDNVDESSVMIYVQNGVIYVEGAETDYHVLDAAGRLIYTGRDAVLSLPRGVYVVVVGDEVEKVVL